MQSTKLDFKGILFYWSLCFVSFFPLDIKIKVNSLLKHLKYIVTSEENNFKNSCYLVAQKSNIDWPPSTFPSIFNISLYMRDGCIYT